MRRFAILSAGLLVLSACDDLRPPAGDDAPAPSASAGAFAFSAENDLSGYYMPVSEVAVGSWRLKDIFIGQKAEFDGWTSGDRSGTFGPVMIEFEDSTSPMTQTELGEVRSGQARVLPSGFAVSDDEIRFEGRSPQLGRVTFDGRLDPGALSTARRNLGDDGVVLNGTLTAGGRTIRGVRLRWWMGD